MRTMSRRVHAKKDVPVYPPIRRDELERTLRDFLSWMEQSKDLSLCQAFKPQYDWYMPTITSKESLVREYLHKRVSDQDKQELAA